MSKRKRCQETFPFILDCASVCAESPPSPVTPLNPLSEEDIRQSLVITASESDSIAQLKQGTDAWLNARKNRLTASNFGAVMGMNPYCSPNKLLRQLLWEEFRGNAATRWGSEHEDIARDAYVAKMKERIRESMGKPEDEKTTKYVDIWVEETGLFVNPIHCWLGSSPDGIVHGVLPDGTVEKFLLEIKCPFKKTFYKPKAVPDYYNCQIQGVMANMDLPFCHFVVWIPNAGVQITYVDADVEFWNTQMFPALHDFYFTRYLPALSAKSHGGLRWGEIEEPLQLVCGTFSKPSRTFFKVIG